MLYWVVFFIWIANSVFNVLDSDFKFSRSLYSSVNNKEVLYVLLLKIWSLQNNQVFWGMSKRKLNLSHNFFYLGPKQH